MLVNAFVLFKLHDAANDKKLSKDFSSLEFIEQWLQELDDEAGDVSSASSSDEFEPEKLAYKQHRRKWWSTNAGEAIRLKHSSDWLHATQDARHVYVTKTADGRIDLRRNCMWCGERTFYFCSTCMVPICIGKCSLAFHTLKKLPRCC
jgi:hypothetical protein